MLDSIFAFITEYGPRLLVVWLVVSLAVGLSLGRWLLACSDGSVHQQRRQRSAYRNRAIGQVHGERNAANLDQYHA